MSFLSPNRLWLLLVLAVVVVAYLLAQKQRSTYAARLASADMLGSVLPSRPGWRRHVTAALVIVALAVFTVAFAQPARLVNVPRERATVIVAIDVSLSMEADDVDPNRLVAAKLAAGRFIDELPSTLNVGIVSFAGSANVLVAPTTDRVLAHRAIDNLRLDESTAIGEAIFTSLDALEQVPADDTGELPPARIVLLSDGETTVGRGDSEAIIAAQEADIPVSTIAFGTKDGTIVYDDPTTPAIEQDLIPVPVGDDNLRAIAELTGGAFFTASSLDELDAVYSDIGTAIGYEKVEREITDWFVGLGLLVLIAAIGLSMWWFQRMI